MAREIMYRTKHGMVTERRQFKGGAQLKYDGVNVSDMSEKALKECCKDDMYVGQGLTMPRVVGGSPEAIKQPSQYKRYLEEVQKSG